MLGLRRSRGLWVANVGDVYHWCKENADNLSKILQWCWRLTKKSGKSYDPDVQEIKDAWKAKPRGEEDNVEIDDNATGKVGEGGEEETPIERDEVVQDPTDSADEGGELPKSDKVEGKGADDAGAGTRLVERCRAACLTICPNTWFFDQQEIVDFWGLGGPGGRQTFQQGGGGHFARPFGAAQTPTIDDCRSVKKLCITIGFSCPLLGPAAAGKHRNRFSGRL